MDETVNQRYREINERYAKGIPFRLPLSGGLGAGCAVMKEHGVMPSTLADVADAPVLLMYKFINEGSDPAVYNEVLNSLTSKQRALLMEFEMLFGIEIHSPEIELYLLLNELNDNMFPFSVLAKFAHVELEKIEKYYSQKDFYILADDEKFRLTLIIWRFHFWIKRRLARGIPGMRLSYFDS